MGTDPDGVVDGRTANSDRTRAALLTAARDEFAERGYAGARVASIAARAGVNKQLITYHFGGKQGLYDQLLRTWLARERDLRADAPSLGELMARYLRTGLAEPQFQRMSLRRALDHSTGDAGAEQVVDTDTADVEDLRARQQAGEIAADLDPELLLVAITGMVSAPYLSAAGKQIDPDRYADLLRRIAAHLAD